MTPDPANASPDQLAACRAAIAGLDAREAVHYGELSDRAAQLAGLVTAISEALAEDTAALARLDDLDRQVTALARHVAQPPGRDDPARRRPPAAPPGPGDPTDGAPGDGAPGDPVAGLRDWVERVYRPGYGHLAVLGPCWPQHELCLYGLDILSRLWTALYQDPDPAPAPDAGTALLSAQAEYQARILPAIAAQLAAETTRCGHPTVPAYPGARP
jgi:hypothetical protein